MSPRPLPSRSSLQVVPLSACLCKLPCFAVSPHDGRTLAAGLVVLRLVKPRKPPTARVVRLSFIGRADEFKQARTHSQERVDMLVVTGCLWGAARDPAPLSVPRCSWDISRQVFSNR